MSNTLIKFTERVELEVCVGIEDDVVESTNETFEKNEVVDVDIISESLVEITIQFGDGSIALVPRTVFTVIDPVEV